MTNQNTQITNEVINQINQPPKGTYDWLPEEYSIRKYIFDTWRKTCLDFGFQEYLCPIIEYADLYRAKSGEDIGGKELTTFTDRGGRELAIRPEMTPSVTRMVTNIYKDTPKPIKLFSIANFFRNEQPQKGRNREFWQLNYDVFGSDKLLADIESIQVGIEILKNFNANSEMFEVRINNRILINAVFEEITKELLKINAEFKITNLIRLVDKYNKLSIEDFKSELLLLGLDNSSISKLIEFLNCKNINDLQEFLINLNTEINLDIDNINLESKDELALGFSQISESFNILSDLGYSEFIKFDASLMRGFDYYDGIVFEFFDKNPENKRSLFGGGRYNGLANIFENPPVPSGILRSAPFEKGGQGGFPAVGGAPGDETTKIFLENWNLLADRKSLLNKNKCYFPRLITDNSKIESVRKLLIQDGFRVSVGYDLEKISGAVFETSEKKGFEFVAILGDNEINSGNYKIKNLKTREEIIKNIN